MIVTARTDASLREAKSYITSANAECNVYPVGVDMTNPLQVQNLYENLPSLPDVIVNNVGDATNQERIVDSDPDAWWYDCVRDNSRQCE